MKANAPRQWDGPTRPFEVGSFLAGILFGNVFSDLFVARLARAPLHNIEAAIIVGLGVPLLIIVFITLMIKSDALDYWIAKHLATFVYGGLLTFILALLSESCPVLTRVIEALALLTALVIMWWALRAIRAANTNSS